MKNIIDLSRKNILITGASSGIGKQTAILCSELGARIILVARSEEKLIATINELHGSNHVYYTFDFCNVDEIDSLVERINTDIGKLDGFVHSAGITSIRALRMLTPAIMQEVMSVNFFSFVELVRCITRKKCYNPEMSVVGISSISAKLGNKAKTAYCASKAAMDASVWCMAKELADKHIRVNTVNPALIETNIFQQNLDAVGEEDAFSHILQRQYLGLGKPIDVANMIAFLLSDASQFITGSNINVDGGRSTVD